MGNRVIVFDKGLLNHSFSFILPIVMNLWMQKNLAKLVIVPAIFSLAVAFCHPTFAHAFELTDDPQQTPVELNSHADDLKIQNANHCDLEKKEQTQSTIQSPTQKTIADLAYANALLSNSSLYQNPPLDPEFVVLTRITGPPWTGNNIKGFLGVYRS